MALDARFVLAYHFEEQLVDKDTGLPLSGGEVRFFQDTARTVPKDVYILAGSPPNYTYTNIGPVVDLDTAGLISYNNNNIALYFFPYDGNQQTSTNTVELYYYEAYSSGGIFQFSREAQPNIVASDVEETVIVNYVPNGQFLLHNNLPAETPPSIVVAGEIREPITEIAPGGWTFERPMAATSRDLVTFTRFGSAITNPQDNPRYQVTVENEDPAGSGAFKDLRLKFADVNKFASTTQQYTFTFAGKSETGSNLTVQLLLIKNYGTGGSPEDTVTLNANVVITPAYAQYSTVFIFGDNLTKVIGTQDDDYLQFVIRFPTTAVFEASFTDIGLLQGNDATPTFEATTDRQFIYRAIFQDSHVPATPAQLPTFPDYNGETLYLPLVMTKKGIAFDNSIVGEVASESGLSEYTDLVHPSIHPTTNKLLADGKQYETIDFSPLGIPFSRLQAKYYNTTLNIPIWGTGPDYFVVPPTTTNTFRITNNSPGAVTSITDGTAATGFTFKEIHKPTVATYFEKSYMVDTNKFYMENENIGVALSVHPQNGTTSFTFTLIQDGVGNPLIHEVSQVQPTDGPSLVHTGLAGFYWIFDSISAVPALQKWYVWYKVTNETDPAPAGRTAIQINIDGTETDIVIAQKTREALNAWQMSQVITIAAAGIASGDFFNVFSKTSGGEQRYYVWYKKDGAGTDPAPGGLGIEVDIVSADTDVLVASKSQIAINSKYFAVPDYRGVFLRGFDNGADVDPDASTAPLRWSLVPGIIGDVMGTSELDGNQEHYHVYEATLSFAASAAGGGGVNVFQGSNNITAEEGLRESRPRNTNVNYAIRY